MGNRTVLQTGLRSTGAAHFAWNRSSNEKLGAETQLTKQEPELSLKFRTGAEAIAI